MSSTMAKLTEREGDMTWQIPGLDKEVKTWYKIVGKLDGALAPLVVLHGGPGAGHDYLLGLVELTRRYNIPVVFYDQVGNGLSTHLPEKAGDEAFWREPLFIRELHLLLDHLKLKDTGYHLYGQSWGGMLGSSFAAERPKGLRRLVLANAPADIGLWKQCISNLRAQLPADVQKTVDQAEATNSFETTEYQEAVSVFYKKHLCRTEPWPAPEVAAAIRWLTEDTTVYGTMNGPSEMTLSGSLTGWTVLDRLHQITAPTLVYNGELDEAQDLCVAPFFEKIPRVRWVTVQNASHFTHVEEREKILGLIGDFLSQDA